MESAEGTNGISGLGPATPVGLTEVFCRGNGPGAIAPVDSMD
jgi:hypothetical protein